MNRSTVLALSIALVLAGCAAPPYRPVIDTKNVDNFANMETDMQQCQSYAVQRGDAATNAAAGAVVGSVFGAAVGAILCGSRCARKGAALGALTTGTSAAGHTLGNQETIVKNCMAGRGYSVLN